MSETAQQHNVHLTQINVWKKQVTEVIITLFEQPHKTQADDTEAKIALLYQQIGQLQFELDWLKKTQNHALSQCKKCIDPEQYALLGLARFSFYYTPRGESAYNLELMKLIDKQYLDTPFFGVGQFTDWLCQQGYEVNPKRVRRLFRLMGLCGVCPEPHTSKPGKGYGYKVYPYLLNALTVN